MSRIQKIRQRISDKDYYISSHAEDEMLDDKIERVDIENAVLKGRIEKKLTEDIRGVRYRIEGPARDGRKLHVICRQKDDGNLIIITAYALTEGI
ncbi:MAG: DUF4258 domain-containing protein [Deltaproteobacteria bacterium]|nr:DUF4258 domain-containing protein [Deltaproteobacteria bacterium]